MDAIYKQKQQKSLCTFYSVSEQFLYSIPNPLAQAMKMYLTSLYEKYIMNTLLTERLGHTVIIAGYLLSLLYTFFCMGLSFIAYRCGLPKPYSRKIVHILVGFEWVILYHFFGPSPHSLAVCLFFTIFLAVTYRRNLMPMMSSDGDNAPGTVYYAISMTAMAIVSLFEPSFFYPFGIAVFCTSFGDGLAGVLGRAVRRGNRAIYGGKTWIGTLAAFLFSAASVAGMSTAFHLGIPLWQAGMIALFAAELELFTSHGLDNLTVPIGTSVLAYAFTATPGVIHYIAPILLTPLILAIVTKKKVLTPLGTAFAVLADLVVSVSLCNFGFILLLFFLVGAVLIDQIKKKHKEKAGQSTDAVTVDRTRDAWQVLANGLIPMIAAFSWLFTRNPVFLYAYVAALAEALADTAASGIGSLSGRAFDLFRMRACTPGLSGGMSWLGTLASLLAAIVASAVALVFRVLPLSGALICAASAFLGAVFDSFLGSLFQVKYRCPACGKLTERRRHCDTDTVHASGIPILNNDGVNLLSGAFSTVVAAFLSLLL